LEMCDVTSTTQGSIGSDVDIWSKFMESVRKDVKCMFGILKQQFHVLKHNVRLQNKAVINDIFICCCILHTLMVGMTGTNIWLRMTSMISKKIMIVTTWMRQIIAWNWCVR